ncbi:MAG: hypothetical protein ACK4OO_00750 [bacterium]
MGNRLLLKEPGHLKYKETLFSIYFPITPSGQEKVNDRSFPSSLLLVIGALIASCAAVGPPGGDQWTPPPRKCSSLSLPMDRSG